jgi:uncharacterized phage protein (TIGR02220 family)
MRARYLKPGFFTSVDLAKCRIQARYFYEGVWCYSDNLGRFKWELLRIEAAVFPYEVGKYDVPALMCELILTSHVVPYQGDNGCWYAHIPTHDAHFPDETKRRRGTVGSKLPAPPEKINLKQTLRALFGEFPGIPKNSPLYYDSIDSIDSVDGIDPPNPPIGGPRGKPSKPEDFKPGKTIPYPELYEMVIADLNAVTGKEYKYTSEETKRLIRARWNQGFDLGDFRHVHRVKFYDWDRDPSRNQYLRPKTLYGTKFEGYRNQKMPHPMKGFVSDLTLKNLEQTAGWEDEE